MKATTVKEVLIATKWILENVGWCKGAWVRDDKGAPFASIPDLKERGGGKPVSFCLTGAIDSIECDSDLLVVAKHHMHNAIKDGPLWLWNDVRSRTKEEVIQALDRAIKELP